MDEDTEHAALHQLALEQHRYRTEAMNIDQLKKSAFLKKEDFPEFPKGRLLTVRKVESGLIGKEEGWLLYFRELAKPMVLRPVNAELAAEAFKTKETDHWCGRKIVVYADPTVVMEGKRVGGIRMRAPKLNPNAPAPAAPTPPPPEPMAEEYDEGGGDAPFDDDIPF